MRISAVFAASILLVKSGCSLTTSNQENFIFVADKDDAESISFDAYKFLGNSTYELFWQHGVATNSSFNHSHGNVVFDLNGDSSFNALLRSLAAVSDELTVAMELTDDDHFPHLRSALGNHKLDGDYELRYFDQSISRLDLMIRMTIDGNLLFASV